MYRSMLLLFPSLDSNRQPGPATAKLQGCCLAVRAQLSAAASHAQRLCTSSAVHV